MLGKFMKDYVRWISPFLWRLIGINALAFLYGQGWKKAMELCLIIPLYN